MKKILSVVLAVVILCYLLPINSITANAATDKTIARNSLDESEMNKIYYSDIFWGYPKILKTVYIPRYRHETWEALTLIKTEYITTNDYSNAAKEHGINIALDSADWAKYLLDNAGVTNFQHNEELDKANILFVQALSQINLESIDNAVAPNKFVGAIVDGAKIVEKLNKAVQDDKDYYSHLTKVDLYDYFAEKAFADLSNYCPKLETQFQSLRNTLRTTFSDTVDILEGVEDAVDFAKGLAYSIRLQEANLDLIQDVIDTQPKDSTLYKGMVRLYKQINDDFCSYYIGSFITEKIYDDIAGYLTAAIADYIVGKNFVSLKSLTLASLKLLNALAFVNVDYSEYSTASILSYYAKDFYDSMMAKADQIGESCTFAEVKEYETLFNAYIATTQAAFQAWESPAVHNSEYTDDWCREQQSIYCAEGQYQTFIEEIKNTLLSMTEDERAVFMRAPYQLQSGIVKSGTDNPEDGYIYTVKGQTFTGISLSSYSGTAKLVVEEGADIVVLGDVSLGRDSLFNNKADVLIHGDLKLSSTDTIARFINDGTTEIIGNISEVQSKYSNNSIESNVTDSVLYVAGDISLYEGGTYRNKTGKLVLNGDSTQTISHLSVYNLEVLNAKGIALDRHIYIKGKIDLNGYPCDTKQFKLLVYSDAQFDEDSVFPNAIVVEELVIPNKVTFSNLGLRNGSSLTIAESGNLTVLDELKTGVDYVTYAYNDLNYPQSSPSSGDCLITNNGNVVVAGDLVLSVSYVSNRSTYINNGITTVQGDINTYGEAKIQSNNAASVLYVGGNVNLDSPNEYQNELGKLVLNGDTVQSLNSINVYNLEVTNPEGIILNGNIYIKGRIDLNGNPCNTNNCNILAYPKAEFDEDSIFQNVKIASETVTISNKVTFSGLGIYDDAALTVTESGDVTVLGDLKTGVSNSGCGEYVITNNGNITITGNLVLAVRYVQFAAKYYNNGTTTVQGDIITYGDARIRSDVNDSILRVGGDINLDSPYWEFSIDEGVLILNGSEQQKVNIQKISDLYIENKSSAGVSLSTIQVTHLFDHQGNVFTTTSSSTFVDYDGDGLKDNVDPHPTIAESCLEGHTFGDWLITIKPTPSASGVRERICSKCNTVLTEEIPQIGQLSFKGASLSLQHNLAINYKVDKTLFDDVGYADPYVVFELNGVKTKVASYTVSGDRYVFSFRNIAPNQMNDTIRATLYATYGGVEYASAMREYSVAEYCYSMLDLYAADQYAELRTLLVDLLNYGAASQTYTGYRTDALVNASLTDAQLQWGTSEEPALDTVLDTTHKTVENPTAKWKGAGLNLQDSVSMRLKFAADSAEDLKVKVESGVNTWTIYSDKFLEEDGVYYVYFTGLDAGQMRQSVYLTIYDGDTPVSNTVCYSIGSYAYEKQNSTITGLPELVKAMMKYGDSAYAYVH